MNNRCTISLKNSLDSLSFEDDDFPKKLLGIARLFRSFPEAMDEFILAHGFTGDPADTGAKAAFIRSAFERAGMTPPREIREWYTLSQPIERETAFRICFAFGLSGWETDDFFRRVCMKGRSLDCHRIEEAVYYYCLNAGLDWAQAQDILKALPAPDPDSGTGETVHTGSIIAGLNGIGTREELIAYLTENVNAFTANNVTAREIIRRLWTLTAGPEGLLIRERRALPSSLDDKATGKKAVLRAGPGGVKPWDACLAILQLDKKQIRRLNTDRSLKPILDKLHPAVGDAFPDRQGIDLILRGKRVSYERVRKWLVLLTFYTFWAGKALAQGSYLAGSGDGARCLARMDQFLLDAGYPALYAGNPYDWLFLWAMKDMEPLAVFREIWQTMLGAPDE